MAKSSPKGKKGKGGGSKRIIKAEFERKKEQLLREMELKLTLEKRHQGMDDFRSGDMKPFVKEVRRKLVRLRKTNLIKSLTLLSSSAIIRIQL